MGNPLNLFPARIPIGRALTPDGRTVDVMMTREFANALSDLLVRVGGPSAMSLADLATMFASESTDATSAAALRAATDLGLQLASDERAAARIAALEQKVEDLARQVASSAQAPVDWEHPGKIGAATTNTAKFTAATVVTLNKITFTLPANAATLTIANNKTFTVTDSVTLGGNDGATLAIGAGGALGSAAYKDITAFASSSNTALAPVATDPASTQALANSIRSILLSVQIGT